MIHIFIVYRNEIKIFIANNFNVLIYTSIEKSFIQLLKMKEMLKNEQFFHMMAIYKNSKMPSV